MAAAMTTTTEIMALLTDIRDAVRLIAGRLPLKHKGDDTAEASDAASKPKRHKAEPISGVPSSGQTEGVPSDGETAPSLPPPKKATAKSAHVQQRHMKRAVGSNKPLLRNATLKAVISKQRIDTIFANLATTQPWSPSFPHDLFADAKSSVRLGLQFRRAQQANYRNGMHQLADHISPIRMNIDREARTSLLHRLLQISQSWDEAPGDGAPARHRASSARDRVVARLLRYPNCDVNYVSTATLYAVPILEVYELVRGFSKFSSRHGVGTDGAAAAAAAAATMATSMTPSMATSKERPFGSASQFITRRVSVLELVLELVLFHGASLLEDFSDLVTRNDLDPTGAWPWLKQWLFVSPDTTIMPAHTQLRAKLLLSRRAALTEAHNSLSMLWDTVKPRRDSVVSELLTHGFPAAIVRIVVVDYLGWYDECMILPPLVDFDALSKVAYVSKVVPNLDDNDNDVDEEDDDDDDDDAMPSTTAPCH